MTNPNDTCRTSCGLSCYEIYLLIDYRDLYQVPREILPSRVLKFNVSAACLTFSSAAFGLSSRRLRGPFIGAEKLHRHSEREESRIPFPLSIIRSTTRAAVALRDPCGNREESRNFDERDKFGRKSFAQLGIEDIVC